MGNICNSGSVHYGLLYHKMVEEEAEKEVKESQGEKEEVETDERG